MSLFARGGEEGEIRNTRSLSSEQFVFWTKIAGVVYVVRFLVETLS